MGNTWQHVVKPDNVWDCFHRASGHEVSMCVPVDQVEKLLLSGKQGLFLKLNKWHVGKDPHTVARLDRTVTPQRALSLHDQNPNLCLGLAVGASGGLALMKYGVNLDAVRNTMQRVFSRHVQRPLSDEVHGVGYTPVQGCGGRHGRAGRAGGGGHELAMHTDRNIQTHAGRVVLHIANAYAPRVTTRPLRLHEKICCTRALSASLQCWAMFRFKVLTRRGKMLPCVR